ncbi:MAG: triose-phosphate isomerase [Candidatus Aminicenantes bacterium]|nr:triose-phosphate isomerase [Candidatus Aminicenantes bacterium]
MGKEYLIAGNWKMYKNAAESRAFVSDLAGTFTQVPGLAVAVFPPFTALAGLRSLDGKIKIGAQNMFYEEKGAFTGEISPLMLQELVDYVLIGHSERREIFKESDEDVNKKIRMALQFNLLPVLCVGETLQERETGKTRAKIERQLEKALHGVASRDSGKIIIAYEPIWAIGTGLNATPKQAQEVHHFIKGLWRELAPGQNLQILYGGSVKPENSLELLAQEDVAGVLVGGASLKIESFSAIIQNCVQLLKQ